MKVANISSDTKEILKYAGNYVVLVEYGEKTIRQLYVKYIGDKLVDIRSNKEVTLDRLRIKRAMVIVSGEIPKTIDYENEIEALYAECNYSKFEVKSQQQLRKLIVVN